MSTEIATRQPAQLAPPQLYRRNVESIAMQALHSRMEEPAARDIAGRFALSFATAARTAKDPGAYYSCDPSSLAAAVSMSIDTGLVPGGALPEVYLVPRGGELQWMPTHRGLIKLAREAGVNVRAVAVGAKDTIEIEDGEVSRLVQDPDSQPESLEDLRGVVVYARSIATGERIAAIWVNGAALRKRSKAKGAGPVWREWPIEMAIKSAIRYAFARGYVPLESVKLDSALAADAEPAVLDVEPAAAPRALPMGEPPAALRTSPSAPVVAPSGQVGLGGLAPAEPVDEPPADEEDF